MDPTNKRHHKTRQSLFLFHHLCGLSLYIKLNLILLVTTHISIRHQVQLPFVMTRMARCREHQLLFTRLLQIHLRNRLNGVLLRISQDQPPCLAELLRELLAFHHRIVFFLFLFLSHTQLHMQYLVFTCWQSRSIL